MAESQFTDNTHMDRIAKILIVDDEQATLKMLSTLVSNEGYSFETALNGSEALEKAKAADPDIILLDIIMPRTLKGTVLFILMTPFFKIVCNEII